MALFLRSVASHMTSKQCHIDPKEPQRMLIIKSTYVKYFVPSYFFTSYLRLVQRPAIHIRTASTHDDVEAVFLSFMPSCTHAAVSLPAAFCIVDALSHPFPTGVLCLSHSPNSCLQRRTPRHCPQKPVCECIYDRGTSGRGR